MNVRVPGVATSKNSDPSKPTLAMPSPLGRAKLSYRPGGWVGNSPDPGAPYRDHEGSDGRLAQSCPNAYRNGMLGGYAGQIRGLQRHTTPCHIRDRALSKRTAQHSEGSLPWRRFFRAFRNRAPQRDVRQTSRSSYHWVRARNGLHRKWKPKFRALVLIPDGLENARPSEGLHHLNTGPGG